MDPDAALLALERHATSKIQNIDDLERISTLGFRGEALPSIASVSKVRLVSSDVSHAAGSEIRIEGGTIKEVHETGCPKGTTLEVYSLFYNTPVRKKFLKTRQTELSHITGLLTEMALAHPHVYFTLRHGSRTLLKTPPVTSLLERSLQLFGKGKKGQLMEVEEGREGLHLFGLVSVPGYTRPSGTGLNFFVNRRPIRDRSLRHAVYEAYETLLMKGRHPEVYLFLDVDPARVDVNVHPTKREVRFTELKQIHDFLRDAVRKTVQGYGRTPTDSEEGVKERSRPFREERVREAVETYLRTHDREMGQNEPSRSGRMPPADSIPHVKETYRPAVQSLYENEKLIPIGQIANSYIICEDRDGLILVDQHAAHERILYEKFKNYYTLSKIPVQHLLLPVNLELNNREEILINEHLETLHTFGIEIEDFGHGTYTVKGVPMWIADGNIGEVIRSILEEIDQLEKSGELQKRMEEIIHIFSCRSAVKANQRMSLDEMKALLKDLRQTDSPHTCEHGRPTMIRIGLSDIEKLFQRR
jgi:DNA mismatch repair protein MutL